MDVPENVDWTRFMVLVQHHGMGPHVHGVLGASSDVPNNARAALAAIHKIAVSHSLLLTGRLLQILDAFASAKVPVVTLKGPALSQQLYGDALLRDSVDLDLFVPPSAVSAAASVLQERGYALESELGWLGMADLTRRCTELTFRHATGTGVDLHWASAPSDYPFRLPESRLWASVSSVSVNNVAVPVLSRDCQLVYLCVHGTRHGWTKLRWLADIASLVSSDGPIDWDEVDSIAAEAQACRPLALGLLLARRLPRALVPDNLLDRLQDDSTLQPFVEEVERRLESAEPAPQPSAVERTMFNARLAATQWQRARHVAALFSAPTDADAQVIKLPRRLLLLYYPLRAVRLAAKYGRALVTG